MGDNIRVVCRFRPINEREKNEGELPDTPTLDFLDSQSVRVRYPGNKLPPQVYVFDRVFHDPNTTQAEVYEYVAKPTVEDVLNGYNGTIFAYGQTGAGKSFSMFGPKGGGDNLKGIIPRAVEHIFRAIDEDTSGAEFQVKVSFLEIYKEVIRDLLDHTKTNLKVRDTPTLGVWVDGLSEKFVQSAEDVYYWLEQGEAARATSATNMNLVSSRSHSLFIITIHQRFQDGSTKQGKLNLADLAGSEKVGKTGAVGETLEEAKKINQSLSALGNCINALTKAKRGHVPYRDSRLTHILKESLGGNSKTTLLIACSPHSFNMEETISTLKFGQRAKTIKNIARINQQRSVAELELIISRLTKEMNALRAYIKELERELVARDPSFDLEAIRKKIYGVDTAPSKAAAPGEEEEKTDDTQSTSSDTRDEPEVDDAVVNSPSKAYLQPSDIVSPVSSKLGLGINALLSPTALADMQVKMQRMQETYEMKIQDLEEERDNLLSERKTLEEKLLMAEQKTVELENEASEEFEKLTAELDELKHRHSSLEYEFKQLSFESDLLKQEISTQKAALKSADEQLAKEREQRQVLESENVILKESLARAREDLNNMLLELQKARDEAAQRVSLEARLHESEMRLSEMKASMSQLQANRDTLMVDLDAKSQENKLLEATIAEHVERQKALEAEVARLIAEKEIKDSEMSKDVTQPLQARIEEQQQQLREQSSQLDALRKELAELKKQQIYLSGDVAKKEAERLEIARNLEEEQKKTKELTSAIEEMRAELDERIQELITVKDRLAQELSEKEQRDEEKLSLQRAKVSLEAKIAALMETQERELQELKNSWNLQNKQLEEANARLKQLENEALMYKTKYQETQVKYDASREVYEELVLKHEQLTVQYQAAMARLQVGANQPPAHPKQSKVAPAPLKGRTASSLAVAKRKTPYSPPPATLERQNSRPSGFFARLFGKKPQRKPDEIIKIAGASVNIRQDIEPDAEFKFQFIITHPAHKPIYLATTKDEIFKWIEKIDEAIAYVPPTLPPPAMTPTKQSTQAASAPATPSTPSATIPNEPSSPRISSPTPDNSAKLKPAHPLASDEEEGFTKL